MRLTPFGLIARTLRLELGLTLKKMADALSVSSAYLSSIELGERDITPKIAADTVNFFQSFEVSDSALGDLQTAIDRTAKVVPIEDIESEDKYLVAAFARRLTEGSGVPDEVRNWLQQGGRHGRD